MDNADRAVGEHAGTLGQGCAPSQKGVATEPRGIAIWSIWIGLRGVGSGHSFAGVDTPKQKHLSSDLLIHGGSGSEGLPAADGVIPLPCHRHAPMHEYAQR